MTRPSPADAYVAPPWLPDVSTLDHYAAALADEVARDAARGLPRWHNSDTGRRHAAVARAYVAVCDVIDRAWIDYAHATRGDAA